jgi:putative transposase
MAKKTRHSKEEIAAKLAQARELAAKGELQSDIARTLGVSVMTLHRWRNAAPPSVQATEVALEEEGLAYDASDRIDELQIENSRLRRLVTDLLLEKMKLEECSQGPKSPTKRASR